MGIQINGVTDSISAVDGSLSLTGAELASVGGINVSGVVTATTYIVGSGSTSAPSISPSGDSNTGIFFPSADTIAFGEGGAEVARFDSNGRLGIGTNTINAKLEISGNSGGRGIRLSEPSGEELDISAGAAANDPARIATSSGSGIAFAVNGTSGENARIDTSGRFGIGTTAPIAQTHIMLSDVTGYTSPSNDGFVLERGGGNDVAISIATDNTRNGYLIFADGDSANPAWVGYDHSANAMSFRVNASERARIDSSGRLLVGTSSAGSSLTQTIEIHGLGSTATAQPCFENYAFPGTTADRSGYLQFYRSRGSSVGTNTIVASGDQLGVINFRGANGSSYDIAAQIRAEVDGTPGASNDMPGRLVFSTTADGASSPTERWRITSGGAFYSNSSSIYIGTGGAQMSGGGRIIIRGDFYNGTAGQELTTSDDTNGAIYMQFGNSVGTRIGSITRASSTSIAFNSTSDYRLKENIAKVDQASQKIQQLRPVTFNFIGHANELSTGFIAHELQEIIPEAVSGAKDAVYADGTPNYQGVDQSKLVPLLTAALQEAITKIETLEARLTALETA